MAIIKLTEKQVYSHFGHTFSARGDAYQRSQRVRTASIDEHAGVLEGEVQGTDSRPYSVRIILYKGGSGIRNEACTCPMGGYCKHSAALALHAIRTGILSDAPDLTLSTSHIAATEEAFTAPQIKDSVPNLAPPLSNWLSDLSNALSEPDLKNNEQYAKYPKETGVLFYIFKEYSGKLIVEFKHGRKSKNGTYKKIYRADITSILREKPDYVKEEDSEIISLFLSASNNSMWSFTGAFPSVPEIATILIDKLISTNRAYWMEVGDSCITMGKTKKAGLRWQAHPDGTQTLKIESSDTSDISLIAGNCWYVNPIENTIGPLEAPVPMKALKSLLNAPRISPKEAIAVSMAMASLPPSIPRPVSDFTTETITLTAVPRLKLISQETPYWYRGTTSSDTQTLALLRFDYGEIKFGPANATEVKSIVGKKIIIQKKNRDKEREFIAELEKLGLLNLHSTPTVKSDTTLRFPDNDDHSQWLNFIAHTAPLLSKKGWVIETDQSFQYEIVEPEEEWVANATEGADFWFSLDLGIIIEGKTVQLLPIIYQAISRLKGRDPLSEIEQMNQNGIFYAPLNDGRYVALPFERVKSSINTLLELFDKDSHTNGKAHKVTFPQIMELAQSVSSQLEAGQKWLIGERLQKLIERIKKFNGIKSITPPKNFKADLRPYQLEGLSWLNFLREFELGGILADDMGLGKTVQTIAHIACEKKANRLEHPYLVICPTSVLPNWLSEIKKFMPSLKVNALHGTDRAFYFKNIKDSDIVVTTYPLVPRDLDTLAKQKWQAVILDESQYIKNPQTQIAQAVRTLKCNYRICLTGTPIENHLGELWSQFNFLMPGFLQDSKTFARVFRAPIEKQNNALVKKRLATKVRPFLLRRTKELVVKELPEKTVIIKTIELEGKQRDLYETVRLAMYDKVKEALASKGLAKSQIIILDALLKLRQVCCDPKLLSLPQAKSIESSAKLDMLMEMLEELIDEGKRILLFSQFTSMLDLIIPKLVKKNIDFVEIRGDTKDRATPVRFFQNRNIPLFLLSLKAGGTGLNLTAADTVIHYDPWWNPAVENQATDRAHRIGQDKAVFVFKLIASGTIEERMIELQERKKSIAQGVYDDDSTAINKLTAEDLEVLFSPLEID